MPQAPPEPPSPIGLALVLVAVAVVALANLAGLAGPNAAVLTQGALADPDAYLRLVHILDLRLGQPWFDHVTLRLSAPQGLEVQWTRPLDLLILLPALLLEALAGLDARTALLVAGILVSPVLHVAAVVAAAWAARAIWPGSAPWYAAILAAGAPAALEYSAVGRADHHALILFSITLALGAALRALRPAGSPAAALGAGAAFGLGIWTGPEVQLVVAPVLIATGVAAMVAADGRALAAQGERVSVGMAIMLAVAILVEHPPARWLVVEYDRVSVHHLALAFCGVGIFRIAGLTGGAPRALRIPATVGGSALALLLLVLIFPGMVQGPLANADPAYLHHLHPVIAENRPLPPFGPGPFPLTVILVGPAVVAGLPAIALGFPGWVRDGRWPAGLALLATLLAGIATTLAAGRFALDLVPPAAIAGAGLFGMVLGAARPRAAGARAALAASLFAIVLGLPLLGRLSQATAPAAGTGAVACDWTAMAQWLDAERPGVRPGAEAPILLAGDLFAGSEIAWRTPYRSVAAPHHRGGAAIADTMTVISSPDAAAVEGAIRRRGVDLLLICRNGPQVSLADGTLPQAIFSGAAPDWLRPIPLPAALAGFRLLAVAP